MGECVRDARTEMRCRASIVVIRKHFISSLFYRNRSSIKKTDKNEREREITFALPMFSSCSNVSDGDGGNPPISIRTGFEGTSNSEIFAYRP